MTVLADSTVIIHLYSNKSKMEGILANLGIKQVLISQPGYLELLSGASLNVKIPVRKFLQTFRQLEFDAKALHVAKKLAMRYRVGSKQSKDFLIACTAISNKIPLLTENDKDFGYNELEVITYRINQ